MTIEYRWRLPRLLRASQWQFVYRSSQWHSLIGWDCHGSCEPRNDNLYIAPRNDILWYNRFLFDLSADRIQYLYRTLARANKGKQKLTKHETQAQQYRVHACLPNDHTAKTPKDECTKRRRCIVVFPKNTMYHLKNLVILIISYNPFVNIPSRNYFADLYQKKWADLQ